MAKKALITGITGQDGSYLAEFLLEKGYEVHGMYRRSSTDNHFERIKHLEGKIKLVCADLLDIGSLDKIIKKIKPDEVYNLAAQSQVRVSFDQEFLTKEINWMGVERLLEIMTEHAPEAKFYQASTSELYGDALETPQNENTPFNPVSPYSKSKLKAHEAVHREVKNGLFGCSGILFNHESPRRGKEFVTRKITDGLCKIKLGLKNEIELGNLNAKRDWGFAGDYIKAMWLMLQQDKPDDYVIATGESYTIQEFVEEAGKFLDMSIRWEGKYENKVGFWNKKEIIKVNKELYRPAEVHILRGDATKAKEVLKWRPEVTFGKLVEMMVRADYDRLSDENSKGII